MLCIRLRARIIHTALAFTNGRPGLNRYPLEAWACLQPRQSLEISDAIACRCGDNEETFAKYRAEFIYGPGDKTNSMIRNTLPEFEKLAAGKWLAATEPLNGFLKALGIEPERQGELIRLDPRLELLQPEELLANIRANTDRKFHDNLQLEVHRTITSTNDEVMAGLSLPGPDWRLCLADMQTAGKGRRGKNWVSPFGRNIYLSLGGFVSRALPELEGLSLLVGVQVVEALKQQGLEDVGLKWPNDVLLNGGKLAGILVELKPGEARGVGIVVGVGINLALSREDAEGIDQPWSTASGYADISRNALAGLLAARLITAVEQFDRDGFEPFVAAWHGYNLFANREVRVIRGKQEIIGIDRGVDGRGNLLLETKAGLETHKAGEVSLRRRHETG